MTAPATDYASVLQDKYPHWSRNFLGSASLQMVLAIPHYMHDGLLGYIEVGQPTGDFLNALLCNDLMATLEKADDTNRTCLRAYGVFLFGAAPRGCYGDPDRVRRWHAAGGLRGIEEGRGE